ncbi:ribosomal protein RPL27 [Toxoplasma gondii ME49]|uniref:Ribosomal protein L27, putative n=16 Tax=Toxoplasma gondii TaxID=5811 RepID=A0A0F7V234_TOXGV|nr:ribosomal protein RPL27 [Toxoplasma gondii ME49]EPT29661.1 ribosomal protein RPL27 [Toxoplasma gondii ME49]KAF4641024.1 ribosomal protein RPL27 [Toxoplasma gondii]5XXB_Y Chain Y, Ribosomal protein eL27 [Toxoplasma gondii]CEL74180.1 TPA: ribosomal protein L27, putative [Toxoplasma gondii VEG]|eukprot:XP_008882847.1 ribosomal protein RPL27 [Hammondia hammondi]
MVKLLKSGRVVVVLNGRHAGKKGVVVNTWEGSKERQFAFCLVAGIEKAPLKVHKKMPAKKIEKRMRVKPFLKYINVNHLMPTRYTVSSDMDVKTMVPEDAMRTVDDRKAAKKGLKKIFYEKFTNPVNEKVGKVSKDLLFLRKKLRF